MKRFFGLMLCGAMIMGFVSSGFAATQVDALIEKLVEKGILDKKEALKLKGEIAADEKLAREDAMQQGLPDWVKNTKLKGDGRVRYQYERRANDKEGRARGRIRLRLGLENQINPEWKLGAGLATAEVGSTTDDARSTNMTFTDSFRRGDIRLDYAFAEYKPAPWGKAVFGKYVKSDYLWNTTDMLWDTDINPAGFSGRLERSLNDKFSVFANNGLWIIDENGKTDRPDPYLIYTQGGGTYKQGDFDATIAAVYYGFNGVKGIALDGTSSTNTLTGAVLKNDYDSFGLSAELGFKNPAGPLLPIPWAALFSDYIRNVDSHVDENSGFAAGIKFGDKKVAGKGQWQWKYQYTRLGRDAFPDAFPDSDRLGGITDVRGHEAILEFGLSKNVVLGFDYYQDQRIKAVKNEQKIVQVDLNLKF